MIIAENLQDIINYFIPSVFLYAELHYKFTITGSKYFIYEPEIITDTKYKIGYTAYWNYKQR